MPKSSPASLPPDDRGFDFNVYLKQDHYDKLGVLATREPCSHPKHRRTGCSRSAVLRRLICVEYQAKLNKEGVTP